MEKFLTELKSQSITSIIMVALQQQTRKWFSPKTRQDVMKPDKAT
jgi:hypothetical protein